MSDPVPTWKLPQGPKKYGLANKRAPAYSKTAKRYKEYCISKTVNGVDCPMFAVRVTIKGKLYKLKTCMFHAPAVIQNEVFRAAKKKNDPIYKPDEILRARFENDARRYLQPIEDGLTAMKATVVGNGKSAHIEMVADFALRLRAMETLLERVYGRPRQSVEHTGADGDAIRVELPQDDERQRQVAEILAATGALGELMPGPVIPQNPSANEPANN